MKDTENFLNVATTSKVDLEVITFFFIATFSYHSLKRRRASIDDTTKGVVYIYYDFKTILISNWTKRTMKLAYNN